MKFKSPSQALPITLFIISIIALGILLTGQKIPKLLSIMITLIIFGFLIIEFVITKKLKNLFYLIFSAYFLAILPLILPLINNTFLYLPVMIGNFLLIVIFLYHELAH